MSRTSYAIDSPRDGGYEAWMVSATWGKWDGSGWDGSEPPVHIAGYFYTTAHGVVDEESARQMAEKVSTWKSGPRVMIWRRQVPAWERVDMSLTRAEVVIEAPAEVPAIEAPTPQGDT